MLKKLLVLSSFTCLSLNALAGPDHNHTAPVMPKEFDTLKKLVGTWEGKNKMHDKEEEVKVVYTLTSGGTAIEEKLMPGTDHEMVSMYYKDGKSLAMTHYCAMGNQPKMVFKKATGNSLSFEMTKPVGISSMKESHMHAITLTLVDDDHLTQEWTNYTNGKKAETVKFSLKRD